MRLAPDHFSRCLSFAQNCPRTRRRLIKTPKSKSDLDQLYVYQWAAQEFLGQPIKSLKYWYLRDNKFVEEPKAGETEITRLKSELLELAEKIIYTAKYNLFLEEDKKLARHDCEFLYLE